MDHNKKKATKHMKTNIAILLIVGTLTYFLTLHLSGNSAPTINQVPNKETTSQTIGNEQTIPEFTFTDINGKTHNIGDHKGKTIILNFWASWCAPCIKEFPNLLKATQSNKDNVILIALSSDLDEAAIHKFISKISLDFTAPNILIALDKDQAITAKTFNTFKLPETLIIDQNQNLRHKLIGADWEYENLQSIIETLKEENE
jgi:thiol-disulfide isomerase/thioredoxin